MMRSTNYEILSSIDDAVSKLNSAKTSIKTIESKLKNIDNDLMDKRWTGYSNEKCQDINALLKEYNASIETVIGRIYNTVKDLEKSAQNYDSRSNRI